jgi:hypothetical protein
VTELDAVDELALLLGVRLSSAVQYALTCAVPPAVRTKTVNAALLSALPCRCGRASHA